MKIAFLTSDPNTQLIKPLNDHFVSQGRDTKIIDTNTNLSKIDDDYDLVIVRSLNPKYLYLVQFFEERGIRVLNSFRALTISSNKLLTALNMRKAGLETPKTVFVSKKELDSYNDFKFPILLKPIDGRGSADIDIFFNNLRLREISRDELYLQEYISGELIRIYMIGRFGPFFDINGHILETVIPKKIMNSVLKCFESIGIEIGGIDCVKSGKKYYFIDINDMPLGIKRVKNWVEMFDKYLESINIL